MSNRVIGVLKCESSADAVAKAVAKWDSHDLEEAVAAARACGSIVRSNSEWLAHPHGKMLSGKPLVEITKIGDSDPIPFPKGGRPLSGCWFLRAAFASLRSVVLPTSSIAKNLRVEMA